jgi:hypothetical protein
MVLTLMVEHLGAIFPVAPHHKEVNNLAEPQETKEAVAVEEKVENPLHCLLVILVSKLPFKVSNHFSLSVVPLRMLELP